MANDGIVMSDKYINERPEKILELFDWTGVEVEFQDISLKLEVGDGWA